MRGPVRGAREVNEPLCLVHADELIHRPVTGRHRALTHPRASTVHVKVEVPCSPTAPHEVARFNFTGRIRYGRRKLPRRARRRQVDPRAPGGGALGEKRVGVDAPARVYVQTDERYGRLVAALHLRQETLRVVRPPDPREVLLRVAPRPTRPDVHVHPRDVKIRRVLPRKVSIPPGLNLLLEPVPPGAEYTTRSLRRSPFSLFTIFSHERRDVDDSERHPRVGTPRERVPVPFRSPAVGVVDQVLVHGGRVDARERDLGTARRPPEPIRPIHLLGSDKLGEAVRRALAAVRAECDSRGR